MLENRSFDHMLGYLTLEAGWTDVDGLKASMSNVYRGKTYKVRHLQRTALTKDEDPCHGGACIAEQVSNNMGGFVANFAKQRKKAKLVDVVMGYYNGSDLPVYDHLAREFAVCDRWYCSVPGATWPNRLYALCGQAAGSKDPKKVPIYDVPSFVRHLETSKVSWRWYTHDVGTLRFTDSKFRVGYLDKFAYFDRRSLLAPRNFMDDAKDGKLPAVSWIDPNFVDVSFIGPAGIERRPSALGHQGGPGARAEDVHGARQQPELEEDDARRHLRRARRVLRPRAAARRARRPARVPDVRRARARVRRLAVHAARRASRTPSTTTRRSSRRSCSASARRTARSRTWAHGSTNANHLGDLLTLSQPRPPTPTEAYRDAVDRITLVARRGFRTAAWRGRPAIPPIRPT